MNQQTRSFCLGHAGILKELADWSDSNRLKKKPMAKSTKGRRARYLLKQGIQRRTDPHLI